jgi:hypothetical protein
MSTKSGVFVLALFLAFYGGEGWGGAQHQHGSGAAAPPAGKTPAPKSAAKSVTVEGFKVTFEVMSREEHMKHQKSPGGHGGGDHSKSHSLMVTVQDTASKEIISDAKVQYAIAGPGGRKETGSLTWSGDYYGGGFSPEERGTYEVQIRIESGGMAREVKFQYKK